MSPSRFKTVIDIQSRYEGVIILNISEYGNLTPFSLIIIIAVYLERRDCAINRIEEITLFCNFKIGVSDPFRWVINSIKLKIEYPGFHKIFIDKQIYKSYNEFN